MKSSLVRIRHARSKNDFPFLPLEEGEYVELAISRSKAGLIIIWAIVIAAIVLIGIAGATVIGNVSRAGNLKLETMKYFWLLLGMLFAFLMLIGLGLSKVYNDNKMFVTNKRVFHYDVQSLFTKSLNIIELSRVEDVSFKQKNIIDHIFSFGTIRMSTVGDETTYTFPYVDTPTDEIELIAHLIQQVKKK